MDMDVDVDVVMDVDKPGKGGQQGKKEKKGGKAGKESGQRKSGQRKKSMSSIELIFFGNLIGFARLLLEKDGPSPKSKAKEIRYIQFCFYSMH